MSTICSALIKRAFQTLQRTCEWSAQASLDLSQIMFCWQTKTVWNLLQEILKTRTHDNQTRLQMAREQVVWFAFECTLQQRQKQMFKKQWRFSSGGEEMSRWMSVMSFGLQLLSQWAVKHYLRGCGQYVCISSQNCFTQDSLHRCNNYFHTGFFYSFLFSEGIHKQKPSDFPSGSCSCAVPEFSYSIRIYLLLDLIIRPPPVWPIDNLLSIMGVRGYLNLQKKKKYYKIFIVLVFIGF